MDVGRTVKKLLFLFPVVCFGQLFQNGIQIPPAGSGGGGGGVIFPVTNFPICGTSSSTLARACDKATDYQTPIVASVKDFGALCDGVHDDTAAFQAAIDSSSVGILIFIPPGTCMITANLNVNKDNTHFLGSGVGVSVVAGWGSGVTKLFNIAASGTVQLVNPTFEAFSADLSAGTFATKTAFYAAPTRELRIQNVLIHAPAIGISINKATSTPDPDATYISHVKIEYPTNVSTSRGVFIDAANGGNFHITDLEIGSLTQGTVNIGWEIKSGHGFEASNVDIYGWGKAMLIDPGTNQVVSFGQFNALQVDTSTGDGLTLDGTAAFASGYPYGLYNLQFVNLWSASNGLFNSTVGNGVNVISAKSITFSNTSLLSNSGRGAFIHNLTQDIYFDRWISEGNSVNTTALPSNSGTYAGIEVEGGTNSFALTNGKSGQGSYYGNSQKYGALVNEGCSYYHVIGNQFVNNVTSSFVDNSKDSTAYVAMNTPAGNWVSPVYTTGSLPHISGSGAPSGSCSPNGAFYTETGAGTLYVCQSSAWVAK